MKFLCVDCSEKMTLVETRGPDEASLTVVFGCTSCGRKIAMVTNPNETNMVHSLGITIGGSEKDIDPMEPARPSLADRLGATETPESAEDEETNITHDKAIDAQSELQWTPEALERMDRIPSFIRGMVQTGIEDYAKANDIVRVDEAVLKDVRERFGF